MDPTSTETVSSMARVSTGLALGIKITHGILKPHRPSSIWTCALPSVSLFANALPLRSFSNFSITPIQPRWKDSKVQLLLLEPPCSTCPAAKARSAFASTSRAQINKVGVIPNPPLARRLNPARRPEAWVRNLSRDYLQTIKKTAVSFRTDRRLLPSVRNLFAFALEVSAGASRKAARKVDFYSVSDGSQSSI